MPIQVQVNKHSAEKFNRALENFMAKPSTKGGNTVLATYKEVTNYKAYCAWCILGASLLTKGINSAITGDNDDAVKFIDKAIKHANDKNKVLKLLGLKK